MPFDRELFDTLLEELIGELPGDLRLRFEEIPLIVEDEPKRALLKEVISNELERHEALEANSPSDLCGLHTVDSGMERIYLFRGPILRLAGRSRRELKKQIRITLLHELGHHYGLDEDRLAELGYD